MATALGFGQELVRVICPYVPQIGRTTEDKYQFYDEMAKWDLQRSGEMVWELGYFNEHVEKYIDGFEGVHCENDFGIRNMEGRMLHKFCDEKELRVAKIWFYKKKSNIQIRK